MADMTTTGISLGDAMGLCQNANANNGMWNNPFLYLVWLALFGGGFGGWGNNNAAAGYTLGQQTAELQNAIYASNDNQSLNLNMADNFRNVSQQINAIGDGIASATYSINNSLKDGNYAIQNSINALGATVHDGFDKTGYALMENRFIGQQGITGIQQAIAETNYKNAENTCKITTAIHDEAAATRALITETNIQALRDKLAAQGAELQNARFEISQRAQNEYLVNKLGGCGCGGC